MSAAPGAVAEEIKRTLSTLFGPSDVIELRAIHKGRKRVDAGYFDAEHREMLIETSAKLNGTGAAVYVTLNPLDPQLLARCANRVQEFAQATATDTNVTSRCWLLIDIDPQRPKDTSATDVQLELARKRGRAIYAFLGERDWPKPVVAHSGNGVHLLYRIDLPNDDESRDLVKQVLEALAARFDDDAVKVDRTVFNSARIIKLHGTVATKGDHVPSAPWRLSKILNVPSPIELVSLDQLKTLAIEAQSTQSPSVAATTGQRGSPKAWEQKDVMAFLARGGIEATGPEPHDGALRWKLKACPFNPDHGPGESAVFLRHDGRLGFDCKHNSCTDKHWRDLRTLVDGERPAYNAGRSSPSEPPRVAGVATVAGEEIEPETLRRPLPPADPYPLQALGPILGAAAQRAHEVIQAPAALCGQSFLAAASLAAQAHADIEIDGRREPLSLFAVTIAESGERKTGVDRYALQAHRERERAALDTYRAQLKEHEVALMAYEAKKRLLSKGGKDITTDEIERVLQRLGAPPAAPSNPIYLAPTPTLEGLHKLYAAGRPNIGLFHDDGGEFVGGHAMNDDNRMKSAAGLSRLWDFGEFDRIRAGDGAQKYYGRRLALHLMMQPVVAERVLSDEILTGQGLLARTLLVWPNSTIGDRPYVEIDLSADAAVVRYRQAINALLDLKPRLREGTENELDPPTIALTADAKRTWVGVHDALEADQKDGAEFAGIRAWASKAPAQVLRIAGVVTLFENPAARVIEAEAISRAALLVNHHLREASRIVGTASVPLEIRNAEKLRDWCHSEHLRHLHSRAALRLGPACIRTVESFDAAIEVLERTGWAERIEGGLEIDGAKRRRAWRISRATP